MKTKYNWHLKRTLSTAVLVGALTSGIAGAATTLINADTNNGSFEYVNGVNNPAFATKITTWDGHLAGEIDNWTLWAGASNDSGTERMTTGPSHGLRLAFLQPGNSVHNLTNHLAAAGDSFTFSWDHVRNNFAHTVSLVYFNGTNVVIVPDTSVASGTTPGNGKGGTFVLPADSPAIGFAIGLGVVNDSNNWANVDNFTLTVTPVPEPSALLLGSLGGLLVFSRRRATR